ncbi:MAG: SDR family NAD(P)-dependent oxidoreductase [Dehalococcoidia bacterium]|nr:SDR family NAD(P)-dependent oxidoreductase [Dehalococcoidia bacterium]
MAGPLDGRTAIVTGASRGIGEYVARSLAADGARVAVAARTEEVSDSRLPGTIHTVTQRIKDDGGEALAVRMDMRDADSIKDGVQKVVDEWGGLEIIVNNAAILVPGTIETVQERHLDLIWQIDLRGPLLLIKYALPHMKAAGRGHIVNVSSRAGVFPGPGPYPEARSGGAFYGMVKSGLERYSQGLAMELQDDNISVNVLSPQGRIKTPGNVFASNDRENPDLEFEDAWEMGKGTAWICQQGIEFTGHILFDQDLCRERGL